MQPLRLALALGDLRLAISGQLPQIADRLGRHEVGLQQPGLSELAQPRRVAHIGLATRHLLDMTGVDEHQLKVVFEQVPDRLPIDPSGLHHDLADAIGGPPNPPRPRPRAPRQSRSVNNPRTVVANSARCGSRPPAPSGTRTHAVTLALWTSSAATRSTITSITPSRDRPQDRRLRGPVRSKSLRSVLEQRQSGVPEQTPTPN